MTLDEALHILGAVFLVAVVAIGNVWLAAALFSVGWFVREAIQDHDKQGSWRFPWAWSQTKLKEAIYPTVASFLVAAGVSLV